MRIIISENQLHKLIETNLLNEYMDSSFNWEEFNSIYYNENISNAIKYCKSKLGEPIGEGSSRIVFEIDDNSVLKLSLSKDDIMQNLHEYNIVKEINNPLLPKIYGHAEDYSWLWTEKVIPCTHEDFEKILGIPYNLRYEKSNNNSIGFDNYQSPINLKWNIKDDDGDDNPLDFMRFLTWYTDYVNDWEDLWDENETKTFRQWLKHPWFQNLIELFEHQSVDEFFDDNFGIAIRDGKPTIVVLDIGWLN